MTGSYDLIFGMGDACSCSQSLRAAGLQFASFPWDWIGNPSLAGRADLMCNGYKDWFELEDLEFVGPGNGNGKDCYRNRRNGILSNHDFISGVPVAEAYPAVKAKFDRRIAHLDRLIRAAERPILILRLETPAKGGVPTPIDDCRYCRRRLAEHYPGKRFELCLIALDRKRPFADRVEEEVEDGLMRVAFDYADHTPGVPDFTVDFGVLAPFLKSRFSVRDYRTPEEKIAYRRLRRRQKYEKVGAKSFWGFVCKRILKHLHFKK